MLPASFLGMRGLQNAKTDCRFGKAQPPFSALQQTPYWQGQVALQTLNGQVVSGQILPAQASDAAIVDTWYGIEDDPLPVYRDPQWHDWWLEKIRKPDPGMQIFKLVVNGELAGVMALDSSITCVRTSKPLTLLRGLRVAPEHYGDNKTPRSLKGLGEALVTYGVAESIRKNTIGLGVNSSPGVEGFYRKVLGAPVGKAFDGVRDYFELTGESRVSFLAKQFRQFDKLV